MHSNSRGWFSRELGLDPEAMVEPIGTLAEPLAEATTLDEWERVALAECPALRVAELALDAATSSRQLAKSEKPNWSDSGMCHSSSGLRAPATRPRRQG